MTRARAGLLGGLRVLVHRAGLLVVGLPSADAVGRRAEPPGQPLLPALGRGLLLRVGRRLLRVVLAADELDERDLRRVAPAVPGAQDADVAAGPPGEARGERVEQLPDDVLVRRANRARPSAPPSPAAFLASVISFSANGRSSLARGTVVSMCSCWNKAEAMLRSIAIRCSVTRPSFRWATR
jgi:hypothetical protein